MAHQVEQVARSLTPALKTTNKDLVHTYVTDEEGGLSSAAEAEDTFNESVDARITDVSSAFTGRATRTRRSNVLYSGRNGWIVMILKIHSYVLNKFKHFFDVLQCL